MKFSKIVAAATVMFTIASATFQLHADYTDALVDVGDLDTFWSFWTRMYAVSDQFGGLSDVTNGTHNWNCQKSDEKAQLTTRIELEGEWGRIGKLTGWQVRDVLIKGMMKVINELNNQQSYPVYNYCFTSVPLPYPGSPHPQRSSACGGTNKKKCPDSGRCKNFAMCNDFKWGHKLPSMIRLNVYDKDQALRADSYTIKISSSTKAGSGGCQKAGAIGEVLAGFVPFVGKTIERGIKIGCRPGAVIP